MPEWAGDRLRPTLMVAIALLMAVALGACTHADESDPVAARANGYAAPLDGFEEVVGAPSDQPPDVYVGDEHTSQQAILFRSEWKNPDGDAIVEGRGQGPNVPWPSTVPVASAPHITIETEARPWLLIVQIHAGIGDDGVPNQGAEHVFECSSARMLDASDTCYLRASPSGLIMPLPAMSGASWISINAHWMDFSVSESEPQDVWGAWLASVEVTSNERNRP